MTNDSQDFQDKVTYLIQDKWIQRTPMAFVKHGVELFFDTSTAAEIYLENDETRRLDDVRLETLKDLKGLINEIEKGRYTTKK